MERLLRGQCPGVDRLLLALAATATVACQDVVTSMELEGPDVPGTMSFTAKKGTSYELWEEYGYSRGDGSPTCYRWKFEVESGGKKQPGRCKPFIRSRCTSKHDKPQGIYGYCRVCDLAVNAPGATRVSAELETVPCGPGAASLEGKPKFKSLELMVVEEP